MKILFLFSILLIVLIGCGETNYYITPDDYDSITTEPIITQPTVIETSSPEPFIPHYNPFANTLGTLDNTMETIEKDFLTIIKMPQGIEALTILIDDISLEKKAAAIMRLPSSITKTMLLEASIDHLDTIDRLGVIFTMFGNQPKPKKEKTNTTNPRTTKPISNDDEPDDDDTILGTIITAIQG